ncbi:MAG TPA: phage holin family protein [Croceibacterium sp.]
MAAAEDTTLPKQTHEDRVQSEAAAEERSLIDDVEVLIEDGKTYLEAELNYQKTRALFVGDRVKGTVLFALVGFVFAWMALIALTVGLIIALTPPLSAWGATAVVVIVWLLIAAIALTIAAGRWKELGKAFEPDEGEKP